MIALKRLWLLGLFCSVGPVSAKEADLEISVAEIHAYGIFVPGHTARHSGFSRNTMAADMVKGVRFEHFTTEIPGIMKTNFGFQYTINTTPRGQKLAIKSIIRFPQPGLQHPKGRVYTESVENKMIKIGARNLHGYGFDEAWEIVPGQWVFEIWHHDARLIRKTFTVLAHDEAAMAAGESELVAVDE